MGAPPSPPAAARDTPLAQTLRFSKETVINHRRLDLVVPVPPTPSSRAAAVGATVACAGGRGAWPVPGPCRTRWPWRQEGLNAAVTVTAGQRGVSAPGPLGLRAFLWLGLSTRRERGPATSQPGAFRQAVSPRTTQGIAKSMARFASPEEPSAFAPQSLL